MAKTCREAIREVFADEDGTLRAADVIERIHNSYHSRQWTDNTIRTCLIGLSKNHPSGKHYSFHKHAFLHWERAGFYRRWRPEDDGVPPDAEAGQEGEFPEDTSRSLERDLENALASNLGQLEPGLRLYEVHGEPGRQFSTGSLGSIDILAVDSSDNLVVIEVKAGRADDQVCGQVQHYMGWVMSQLAGNRQVRGMIVANQFTDALKYAVLANPAISLKKYTVRFEITDA